MVLYFLLCCVFDRFDNGIKQGFGVIENVAGKNLLSLVVMMGAIPKRRVISRRHIGEMTGGQQSAGRLGEEFNPFFGRHFSPDLTKRQKSYACAPGDRQRVKSASLQP